MSHDLQDIALFAADLEINRSTDADAESDERAALRIVEEAVEPV